MIRDTIVPTDEALIDGFEAGTLEGLSHAEHVRLGLLYLARLPKADALRRLGDGLLLFATLKGQPEKFHVTMTGAWVELLDVARGACPGATPAEVMVAWPGLLNPRALDWFYGPGVLESERARTGWVEPDLAPIDLAGLRLILPTAANA